MMSDLMNENMGHDRTQCFVTIGPEVENRPAIEEHHIGKLSCSADPLLSEADTLEQTHEVESILDAEMVENLIGRKLLYPDNHIRREPLECIRQPVEGTAGERIDLFDRRRFEF